MAMFRHHISAGAVVSAIGVTAVFFYSLMVEPQHLAVLFAIGAYGSILPDVDSDSGLPFYLTFGLLTIAFAGAVLYLTLIENPANSYVLVGIPLAALVGFWVIVGGLIKHTTHHRGIWHSVPMMAVATMGTYVLARYFEQSQQAAVLYGAAMAAGFLSHLVLDEIWATVNHDGNPFTYKRSLGTAMKFFSESRAVNLITYGILGGLMYVALHPGALHAQSMEWLAEHPGSTTVSVVPVVESRTNDGIEARVRAFFASTPVLIEIARCESGFRQYNSDGTVLDGGSGGMIGIFQISERYHTESARARGMDIYTANGNMAYAQWLYQDQGVNPWLDSFDCWHSAPADAGPSLGTPTIRSVLKLGDINDEVYLLQKILNKTGFTIAAEGPGSPGQETNKFGSLTRAAVKKFQCAKNIACSGDEYLNGYGLVGAATRAALIAEDAKVAGNVSTDVTRATTAALTDSDREIARLQNLIAELSAQIFALQQRAH